MAYGLSATNIGGKCLQIVNNVINTTSSTLSSGNQSWTDISGSSGTVTIKQTGSKLLIYTYTQGYTSNANGSSAAIAATNSSGSFVAYYGNDSWARAHNGWTGSYNVGRIVIHDHGITAGGTCTIKLLGGVWSSGSTYYGYPGYNAISGWIAQEITT